MAPELLKQKNNSTLKVTEKIDIYSLGIVLYKMCTSYHPKVLGKTLVFKRNDWQYLSLDIQDFV